MRSTPRADIALTSPEPQPQILILRRYQACIFSHVISLSYIFESQSEKNDKRMVEIYFLDSDKLANRVMTTECNAFFKHVKQ